MHSGRARVVALLACRVLNVGGAAVVLLAASLGCAVPVRARRGRCPGVRISTSVRLRLSGRRRALGVIGNRRRRRSQRRAKGCKRDRRVSPAPGHVRSSTPMTCMPPCLFRSFWIREPACAPALSQMGQQTAIPTGTSPCPSAQRRSTEPSIPSRRFGRSLAAARRIPFRCKGCPLQRGPLTPKRQGSEARCIDALVNAHFTDWPTVRQGSFTIPDGLTGSAAPRVGFRFESFSGGKFGLAAGRSGVGLAGLSARSRPCGRWRHLPAVACMLEAPTGRRATRPIDRSSAALNLQEEVPAICEEQRCLLASPQPSEPCLRCRPSPWRRAPSFPISRGSRRSR